MADRSARDAAESPIVKDDDSEFADSLSLPSRVLELVGLAKEIASHDCSRLHEFIALICDLWDISSNVEVSRRLSALHVPAIIETVLRSNLDDARSLEVMFGLLANMCTHPEMCRNMGQSRSFVSTILASLLSATDPSVCSELCRLLEAAVAVAEGRSNWIGPILIMERVLERLVAILENSLDDELCERCSNLLVSLICYDDLASQSLCNSGTVKAMKLALLDRIAPSQTRATTPSEASISSICRLLECLSTRPASVEGLASDNELVDATKSYLSKFDLVEDAAASICITLQSIWSFESPAARHLNDVKFLNSLLNLANLENSVDDLQRSATTLFMSLKAMIEQNLGVMDAGYVFMMNTKWLTPIPLISGQHVSIIADKLIDIVDLIFVPFIPRIDAVLMAAESSELSLTAPAGHGLGGFVAQSGTIVNTV